MYISVCSDISAHISLRRFKDAWTFAAALDSPDMWSELSKSALKHLDIDVGRNVYKYIYSCTPLYLILLSAIRAYQQIDDVGMVTSLQQIQVRNEGDSLVLTGQ